MRHLSFRKLRDLVEQTKGKKLPTARALRESGEAIVATAEVGHEGELTVYRNGFFLYRVSGKATVGAVDRCRGYVYEGGDALDVAAFEEEDWTIRLMLAGEDRLEHNAAMRVRGHADLFSQIDQDDEDVPTASGDLAERVADKDATERMLSVLTEKQRQAMELCVIQGLTTREAALRLGIRQQSVADAINGAQKKLKKILRDTCQNPSSNMI